MSRRRPVLIARRFLLIRAHGITVDRTRLRRRHLSAAKRLNSIQQAQIAYITRWGKHYAKRTFRRTKVGQNRILLF